MTSTLTQNYTIQEAETALLKALNKVNGTGLKDVCHYIPSEEGFRIHYFSLRKIKNQNPRKFVDLLREFIIEEENPQKVDPKPRPRYPKTRKLSRLNLKNSEIQALIDLAKQSNREDLVKKLEVHLPFKDIKKDMLRSIQDERIDLELWERYVKAIQSRTKTEANSQKETSIPPLEI